MRLGSQRFILILLVVLIMLTACADPPIDLVTITDEQQYGKFNEYVEITLADQFEGSLPTEMPKDSIATAYFYKYDCSVLGDANFCIYFKININNIESYKNEQERISILSSSVLNESNGKSYYLINVNANDIENYKDTKTLDGMQYRFECVVFDDSSNSVEYLSACLWDYYEKVDCVTDVLTEIQINLKTSN